MAGYSWPPDEVEGRWSVGKDELENARRVRMIEA